jgi:type I restriction enzyme S subunit
MSSIPPHWCKKKLKYVASLKSGDSITSDSIVESGEYPVFGGNGMRGYTSAYTHCGKYVLIGRQGALCGNINHASGCFWASEHAVVVDIKGEDDVVWLGELLRSMDLNQYSQSAAQPGLAVDVIANLEIPVPPLNEQRAIAAYLNREMVRLDELVAAKERILALLEEKRAALVTRAVTQGLNPDVPLKSSGLDWLGDIPVHWEVKRAKQLFAIRDERSDTGDEELLTVSHITGVTPRSEKEVFMFKAEDMTGYKLCYPGDLVVNTLWAWMGAMGVASQHGIVSPDHHVYVSKGGLKPAYIEALCRSKPFVAEVIRHSKGVWSSRLRLYPEAFFDMRLPVPPLDEQDTIVAELTRERARTAELEASLHRSIALLKERRSALITAAVTGQFVPETMSA